MRWHWPNKIGEYLLVKQTTWFLSAVLLASSASARLGKTVEECDTLYKASLLTKSRTVNNILIKNYGSEKVAFSCRFYNNICFEIGVSQLDSDGKIQSLTPEQIAALVRTNLGSIPKIDPNEKNVGPNTVEHSFGTDGRYVWREEETPTGIITILRDNTLAPISTKSVKDETIYDHNDSNEQVLKAAEKGNSSAQYELGRRYSRHQPPDYINAIKWITQSAQSGYTKAQLYLGAYYGGGSESHTDYFEAANWYFKAAEKGDADAQFNYGALVAVGKGVKQDLKQAVNWFKMAAIQNHVLAEYYLAMAYIDGNGVPQDEKEAFLWLSKAAKSGFPDAQNKLAIAYDKAIGTQKDANKANEWYIKAAENGNIDAQVTMGFRYLVGLDVNKNAEEGVKWLSRAANAGDANAQASLGFAYDAGIGIPKDKDEAIKWLRKAAANGNADAAERLRQPSR